MHRLVSVSPLGAIVALLVALVPVTASAADRQALPTLVRDPRMVGPVPVPASERDLPTVTAERWYAVTPRNNPLEGAIFAANGDLLFCNVGAGQVVRLGAQRRPTVLLDHPGLGVGGLALTPDGRLLGAAAGDFHHGAIGTITGGRFAPIPALDGYVANDIALDGHGGFYFTDFRGSIADPSGGVYHVAADMRTVTPIVPHLALANGIVLEPDGKTLWVTEYGRNRLLRIQLKDATTVADFGVNVAYNFIGPAPDSMRADADGNLYVALNGQGRVLVLSKGGIPIGQILLPGRDQGHKLGSTSLAIRPGTRDVYIVANDGDHGQGAAIFRAAGFAPAPGSATP